MPRFKVDYRYSIRSFLGDRTIQYPDYGGGFMKLLYVHD